MTVQPTRDQLRALANAATEGPWVAGEPRGWGDSDDEPQSDIDTPAGVLTWDDHGGDVFKPADAEFIAAARNAVPHLLDQLDRAEHRIARLEAQSDIRGRAVVMYRERAREAETRIRRALEG